MRVHVQMTTVLLVVAAAALLVALLPTEAREPFWPFSKLVWPFFKRGDGGGGGWNTATATWYSSYPACCTPGFKGDRSECEDYSGCKYQGMFAAFDDKKPEEWVKSNNIVAFFQPPNRRNRREWERKWKNRRLRLRNPDTGKVMEVTVVDTCDDKDCKGCCSRNARRNGGTLIDLERNTAMRFYSGKVQDVARIQWQLAS